MEIDQLAVHDTAKMKKLMMSPEVYGAMEKRIDQGLLGNTIRRGYRSIEPGYLLLECTDSGRQRIVSAVAVLRTQVRHIPLEWVKMNGAQDHLSLVIGMQIYYPDFRLDSESTTVVYGK